VGYTRIHRDRKEFRLEILHSMEELANATRISVKIVGHPDHSLIEESSEYKARKLTVCNKVW
jgi:hypothetical protein